MVGGSEWRGVLGSLANPVRVQLFARVVVSAADDSPITEADLSAKER